MAHEWVLARAEGRHAPVMFTLANRTETDTRIRRPFDRKLVDVNEHWGEELSVHINSKVFAVADAASQPTAGTATGLFEPDSKKAFDVHFPFPPHDGRGDGTASGRDSGRTFLAWFSRPQGAGGIVDADPVVREPQLVLRPDRRHVARRARPTHALAANRGWA